MQQVICDKIGALEGEISSEKGDFSLFGLFCREDAPNKWDLIVSAPWLQSDVKHGLAFLADRVRAKLTEKELLSLSRIVVLAPDDPVVAAIRKSVKKDTRHEKVELENQDFAGVQVAYACISTSTAPDLLVRRSGAQ